MASNLRRSNAIAALNPKILEVAALRDSRSLSAAALARSAFGANAASAGTDHLVAAANRTSDSHEDAA